MRSSRRAVAAGTGLVAAMLVALSGCSSDPTPGPSPTPELKPAGPSTLMINATLEYNAARDHGIGYVWKPVVKDGRRWSGDPRTYELVCGARFLNADGSMPDIEAKKSPAPTGATFQTWFDWAKTQPKVWAAFNAWMADPAVIATVGRSVEIQNLGKVPDDQYGDYSVCTGRDAAGVPVTR